MTLQTKVQLVQIIKIFTVFIILNVIQGHELSVILRHGIILNIQNFCHKSLASGNLL